MQKQSDTALELEFLRSNGVVLTASTNDVYYAVLTVGSQTMTATLDIQKREWTLMNPYKNGKYTPLAQQLFDLFKSGEMFGWKKSKNNIG